ncbi:uncharacterized protein DNG_09651 [Cephalotrichum gorgonifer]|uniref:Uncharacterized protein n=1 Tax=Cephalotrichum gorgonifer TaxID=2041049 RepID=A0AAE8N8H3_9PEZI|nr:uncharacterized protein DNG_09651 [Cephalotrichum gorgonifer]
MSDSKSKGGLDSAPLLGPALDGPSNASPPSFPSAVPSDGYLDDAAPGSYLDSPSALPLESYDGDDDAPPRYSDLPAASSFPANPLAPGRREPQRPAKCIGPRQAGSGNERYMDPRLDSDPDYLVEWMEYLAEFPPRLFVRVEGTHTETRTEGTGNNSKRTTQSVTDFDVKVEMTAFLYRDVKSRASWRELRTVGDEEVVRRGTSLRKAAATTAHGGSAALEHGRERRSTLVEWAHRYCASSAGLKTFVLRKEVTGLDRKYILERLTGLVRETGYRGTVRVTFPVQAERATVYSDHRINELRLTRWVRWVFYLTLLFLIVWPYLFLRTKRFEVLVATWPFSRAAADGRPEYVSVSEETWVNIWAGGIRRAVLGRRTGVLDQRDMATADEESTEFGRGEGDRSVLRTVASAMGVVQRQYGWGYDT